MSVPTLRRLAGIARLFGVLMVLQTSVTFGAEIAPGDREAVFVGAVQGCTDKMPAALSHRVGAAAVLSFCSCYAKEIANAITEEQLEALADWSLPVDAIPHFGETERNAFRACEKQFLSKETTANSSPR